MDLTVIGEPTVAQPLQKDTVGEKTFGDYTLSLETDKPLVVGTMVGLNVWMQKNGQPVTTIKPWLGATAHMVGLSEDGKAFVHAHPESEPKSMNGPDITFHTTFTKPGLYKLWAQMDHDGEVRTFPFVVEVKGKRTASAMREVFTCPVVGGKTDPAKKASAEFSDYKGTRYYFCCPGCKPKLDADPIKYATAK
ncbi:MAG: YHS domain-containing protein [Chthonomonadaceae bacterium]|nr:YHS domain-containing protein [Chthonomonadaceae bacterium]